VARIQPARFLFPRGPFTSLPSRSQTDALQHRRFRPERVETTCTDWHLPPTAKGARRRRSLTMQSLLHKWGLVGARDLGRGGA